MKRTLAALTIFLALLPANLPAADLLVDHVEYIRATGAAQQMSLFFPGCDTQGTYALTVKNGQDEAHRAMTGTVSVNGVELVGAADFVQSPAPAVITKMIGNIAERNTLALSATAPQGSIIGWQVTAEVGCPDITIDYPPPGAVLDRGEITVSGRVRHRTPEVGVRVNGVLAQVNGNDWAANEVELDAGGSTLTAEVIDENGLTLTTTQIVNRLDSVEGGVQLKAYNSSGIVPLEVSFAVTNATDRVINLYALDFGDGTTARLAEFAEVTHRYETEGIFHASVTATVAESVEYQDGTAVSVHAMPPLRTRWEKMKAAVVVGETAQALENFTVQEARVQEQIFRALGSRAPRMIEQMQDIALVHLKGDRAQCRIRRNETIDGAERPITYYIEFIRNQDGFWKIAGF